MGKSPFSILSVCTLIMTILFILNLVAVVMVWSASFYRYRSCVLFFSLHTEFGFACLRPVSLENEHIKQRTIYNFCDTHFIIVKAEFS